MDAQHLMVSKEIALACVISTTYGIYSSISCFLIVVRMSKL